MWKSNQITCLEPIWQNEVGSNIIISCEISCLNVTAYIWILDKKLINSFKDSNELLLIRMMCHDLKQDVHIQNPSNVAKLKQLCKEEHAFCTHSRYIPLELKLQFVKNKKYVQGNHFFCPSGKDLTYFKASILSQNQVSRANFAYLF